MTSNWHTFPDKLPQIGQRIKILIKDKEYDATYYVPGARRDLDAVYVRGCYDWKPIDANDGVIRCRECKAECNLLIDKMCRECYDNN